MGIDVGWADMQTSLAFQACAGSATLVSLEGATVGRLLVRTCMSRDRCRGLACWLRLVVQRMGCVVLKQEVACCA